MSKINKLQTAEEFLKEAQSNPSKGWTAQKAMIEFAKLHCDAQLDAILKNLKMIQECGNETRASCNAASCNWCSLIIDTNSIINAYNLNDIK